MEHEKSIGALWVRKSKKDETYMTGQITLADGSKLNFVSFKNKRKSNPKQPDFTMYPQKEYDKSAAPTQDAPKKAQDDELDL